MAEPMTETEKLAEAVAALEHVADGIAHARECGGFWSQDQKQSWLNGLELLARKTLAKLKERP